VSAIEAQDARLPAAVQAFARLLRARAVTARCLEARLLADHGLTLNDYEVLYLLSQAEGRRAKRVDVARHLGLTPSGVTRLLEGLEATGLVVRAECPGDLRVTYAVLTEQGAALLASASCDHERSVRALLEEHLEPAEIEALAELLGKLPGIDPQVRLTAPREAG
jgi:DNA-binding MarR family transcriptional regulator